MLARPHGQVPSVYFPNVTTPAMQPVQSKSGTGVDPWSISQDLVILKNVLLILSVNYLEQLSCDAFFSSYEGTIWQFYLDKITWVLVIKQ